MEPVEPTEHTAVPEVLRVIGDLAEPLEHDAVLARVGRVAAESIGADVGFVGVADGPDHLQLGCVHGGRTNQIDDLRVERGQGLGGKVLAVGSPTSVLDYTTAESITHEYDQQIAEEGLSAMLCLPISLGDELAGVAYVSNRVPKVYSDIMIERVLTSIESAKIALSLADRSRVLTDAAVEAERARTVKVLDDSVGEHLGSIMAIAKGIAADPNSSPAMLSQAATLIEATGRASSALSGSVAGLLLPPAPPVAAESPLSPRELEVVQLAAQGLSNPEIAEQLFLARGTVKAYMESTLRKLDARNRVEAVMIAARGGLLDDL